MVIAHASNFFLKSHPFPPDLAERTSHHVLPEIREYFREVVEEPHLPFHYHCCKIKRDWEVLKAAPDHYRVPLLQEAARAYYIEDRFKDAIVILLQDDLSLWTPDDRSYTLMASQVIAPLLKQWKVSFRDTVFWFDEIFNWDKYERDLAERPLDMPYKRTVRRMKYFDRLMFNLELMRFL